MPYQWFAGVCSVVALSLSAPAPAHAQSVWDGGTKSAALKWELGYLAMGAIDTVQTVTCLERGICAEGNPLWGKNPKSGKLIAARVGLSLVHFGVFRHINERDPKAALRFAQVSAVVQGSTVLLNARFTFK